MHLVVSTENPELHYNPHQPLVFELPPPPLHQTREIFGRSHVEMKARVAPRTGRRSPRGPQHAEKPRHCLIPWQGGRLCNPPPTQHALFVQRSKETQLKGRDSVGPCVLFRVEK